MFSVVSFVCLFVSINLYFHLETKMSQQYKFLYNLKQSFLTLLESCVSLESEAVCESTLKMTFLNTQSEMLQITSETDSMKIKLSKFKGF